MCIGTNYTSGAIDADTSGVAPGAADGAGMSRPSQDNSQGVTIVFQNGDGSMSSRLLIIFLLFSFCSWSLRQAGATEIPYQSIPNLEQLRDASAMPEFTLPNVAGRKVSLSDFRGKIVMLNFWASWCAPCREEMPAMERLYREFSDRGSSFCRSMSGTSAKMPSRS